MASLWEGVRFAISSTPSNAMHKNPLVYVSKTQPLSTLHTNTMAAPKLLRLQSYKGHHNLWTLVANNKYDSGHTGLAVRRGSWRRVLGAMGVCSVAQNARLSAPSRARSLVRNPYRAITGMAHELCRVPVSFRTVCVDYNNASLEPSSLGRTVVAAGQHSRWRFV